MRSGAPARVNRPIKQGLAIQHRLRFVRIVRPHKLGVGMPHITGNAQAIRPPLDAPSLPIVMRWSDRGVVFIPTNTPLALNVGQGSSTRGSRNHSVPKIIAALLWHFDNRLSYSVSKVLGLKKMLKNKVGLEWVPDTCSLPDIFFGPTRANPVLKIIGYTVTQSVGYYSIFQIYPTFRIHPIF